MVKSVNKIFVLKKGSFLLNHISPTKEDKPAVERKTKVRTSNDGNSQVSSYQDFTVFNCTGCSLFRFSIFYVVLYRLSH